MTNRLANATSPYLLQHAENPVDWWEWSSEAFEEARRRDVPILLSVGYAACHWCHVMAHESFEDAATAAYMNEHFVCIKVDREERPDVDAVYMSATTAMTGQGGWPMTVVADHDGAPFFAGTYFPDRPRHGQPAFTQVLQALDEAWQTNRDQIDSIAASLRERLAPSTPAIPGVEAIDLDNALTRLADDYDPAAGGFGNFPKFPPSMVCEFLGLVAARPDADPRVAHMLGRTLAAMAGGGMYDQLGGGFARYAVDRGWVVPHFEKMLYDNAQLLGVYARWGAPEIALGTADWMLRDLRTEQGGFASALDADSLDSDGVSREGAFYAWTPDQLTEVLGPDDAPWAAELFHVTADGTFEHGRSTLQLRHRPSTPDDLDRLESVRSRLLSARNQRAAPARDDKVVAAWNGLAISGLCRAGTLLDRPDLVDAAEVCARLLIDLHLVDGRLRRVSRDGVVGAHAGVLEDYGCLATGLLDLCQATGDPAWLAHATLLIDVALDRFRAADGGFHDTADDAESLIARPRDPSDNASPSGLSSITRALLLAHALTGEGRFRTAAEQALGGVGALANKAPRFAGWSLVNAVLAEDLVEVAVVGPAGTARDALESAARRMPAAVIVVSDGPRDDIPLLIGRTPVDGQPAAYVCRGFVCDRPITDPVELGR